MLTDPACRNAKPRDKSYKLADERGMYLEVMPNGSKYWRMKYRHAGKENRLALGVYPEVSLSEARNKRDEARKQLKEGVDPNTTKKENKLAAKIATANSFEPIAREWLEHMKHKWSEGHYTYTLRRFEAYVFAEIGNAPISELNAPTLLAMAKKIEAKGTIETTHKVMNTCGQVFRYAIASGRCERNPVTDLRGAIKARPTPKHMNALAEKDLPDLLRKMDAYATDSGGEQQTQLALQLLALTFVRTGEMREATWEEFDLDKAEWRIPAERMKMKAPHVVPLSQQALDVLNQLKEINGAYRLVFPGTTPARPMSKNTVLFALYRMGYRGRMTGHGFRAIASTLLNEMGFDADVIERQLAHAERNKVRAAYHRAEYLPERRKMMQQWANYLDSKKSGADVIPLHGSVA
jgi:integrase